MKKLLKMVFLPFLLLSILVGFVVISQEEVKAVSTGYHIEYHNGGNWTEWGGSLPGCNHYQQESKVCYHYRKWYVIGADGVYQFSADQMEDGQPMTVVRGCTPNNDHYWSDIRMFQWSVTQPECPLFDKNGKYCRNYWISWKKDYCDDCKDWQNVLQKEKISGTYHPEYSTPSMYPVSHPTENGYVTNLVMPVSWYNSFARAPIATSPGQDFYLEDELFFNERATYGLRPDENCDYGHVDDWHLCDWGIYYCQSSHDLTKYQCLGHEVRNTYTINYDGNGATGGSTASSSHEYDVPKNLTANGFTKTNYKFKGWSTNPGDTTPIYADQQSVTT